MFVTVYTVFDMTLSLRLFREYLLLHHEQLIDGFLSFFIKKINESIHAEDVSGVINSLRVSD